MAADPCAVSRCCVPATQRWGAPTLAPAADRWHGERDPSLEALSVALGALRGDAGERGRWGSQRGGGWCRLALRLFSGCSTGEADREDRANRESDGDEDRAARGKPPPFPGTSWNRFCWAPSRRAFCCGSIA